MKTEIITKKWLKEVLVQQRQETREELKETLTQQRQEIREELKEALTQQRKEISQEVKTMFQEQDEKFAQRLIRHFYTKDEIDRKFAQFDMKMDTKFATKEELKQMNEELKSFIGTQTEKLRDDFRVAFDGLDHHKTKFNDHAQRIDNHENRITQLEHINLSHK